MIKIPCNAVYNYIGILFGCTLLLNTSFNQLMINFFQKIVQNQIIRDQSLPNYEIPRQFISSEQKILLKYKSIWSPIGAVWSTQVKEIKHLQCTSGVPIPLYKWKLSD